MSAYRTRSGAKRSKLSHNVSIQDLPDEMLEKILLQLRLEDRKTALRVCKRWSALKPFDLSSVQLIIDSDKFYEKDYQKYHRALLASNRRYKHVVVLIGVGFEYYDLLLEILSYFSGSIESLMLNFEPVLFQYVGPTTVGLSFFAKVTTMSSNLKHLHVDEGVFVSDGDNFEFPTLNNVEELHLSNNLLTLIPNMQDITPNITKLNLMINSKESIDFLRRVSTQLVEVGIWFKPKDDFLAIFTMKFPLLERFYCSCINENYEYEETADSNQAIHRFIEQLGGLKGLLLRSFVFDQIGNLCQQKSCENLQDLCLGMGSDLPLEAHDFRAICGLKHLKRLWIENATVSVPEEFDFPPLESLQMLSLNDVRIIGHFEFLLFRRYAFPSLTVFEMFEVYDWEVRDFIKLYDRICCDMPFLKRLAIMRRESKLNLGPFLEFCAYRRCRELRIKCGNVVDTKRLKKLSPIPVEILILETTNISLKSLQKLIKSMGALRRFELVVCPLRGKLKPEEIRSLQLTFPRCDVILKQRVQIGEPL